MKIFITLNTKTHFGYRCSRYKHICQKSSNRFFFFWTYFNNPLYNNFQLNNNFHLKRVLYLGMKCYHLWCTLNVKSFFWYSEVKHTPKFINTPTKTYSNFTWIFSYYTTYLKWPIMLMNLSRDVI